MNILLMYETYSSGTETAAYFAEAVLRSHAHNVTVQKAHETNLDYFKTFDLIILASPSWSVDDQDGQPHINYKQLFEKVNETSFAGKKFAIFGLGDTSYAHFCGAVDKLELFIRVHGGELLTDSLRIDSFYFDKEKNEAILRNWINQLNTHLS